MLPRPNGHERSGNDKALADAVAATLQTPRFPDEDLRALPVDAGGPDGRLLRHARTDHAGIYELRCTLADGSTVVRQHARQLASDEGVPDKADRTAIAAAIGRAHGYRIAGDAAADAGADLGRWLALLVAVLLVGECLLARRFGHAGAAPTVEPLPERAA